MCCAADENLSFADVGRRLGEIWRGLDEDDKKPYQEQVCDYGSNTVIQASMYEDQKAK